jgi:hypothetical protein
MKKIIIMFAIGLLTQQVTKAQGTIYLSNLGQASAGSDAVGSDSWLATGFETGNTTSSYSLNSVQLAMTDASGNPNDFTVMIYSAIQNGDFSPISSLGTLSGSLNPSSGGIFTYTPASTLILSSSTVYFIVLTAGTSVANGAYNWSNTGTFPISYNPSGGWQAPVGLTHIDNYQSNDGSSWSVSSALFPQFAITATPIPEPSPALLFLLGSGVLIYARRTFHR